MKCGLCPREMAAYAAVKYRLIIHIYADKIKGGVKCTALPCVEVRSI